MGKLKSFRKVLPAAALALILLAGNFLPAGAVFNNLLRDAKITGVSEILLLEDLESGVAIFSRNANMRSAPASLTKIMTAILTLEHCTDLNAVVAAPAYCLEMLYGTGSSNAGIRIGEELTVEQLLYCLLLNSANEAAAILADYVAGGQEAFVAKMNEKAKALGCENTHFANVHGLDQEGHYTTAADIAKIARYALGKEFKGSAVFEKIIATVTYELPANNKHEAARTLLTTNRMLNKYYPDYYCPVVTGVKTGSTEDAGDCIVARASQGGYNYLCVVMRGQKALVGADDYLKNTAFVDAKALLEFTFAHIRLRQVAEEGKAVAGVPVEMARNVDYLQLTPEVDVYALVPEGVGSGNVLVEPIADTMPESVTAPIRKGQPVARASIKYGGEEFAQVALVAADDVSRSASMYLVSLAKQAVKSMLAKALLGAVLVAAAIYLGVLLVQAYKKKRDRHMRVLPDIAKK
ncbi:MAG: D-alanyl-D-alanine carboxypeptidase [Firmicutes bacterium]|nr:D-alanyl-D-alanine carboxypeptidase [Bacillota bacterium]